MPPTEAVSQTSGSLRIRVAALGSVTAILFTLATACAPKTVPRPTVAAPKPSPTAARAPVIRFGLIGGVEDGNVWALFDAKGYSYNNYAVRSQYWPRLYDLSTPEGQFEPQAAAGMPSAVQPDGTLFAATVPLRTDLSWTDGSAFTADDVVFTVDTALSFRLGFDWHAYYDPDWLDHAEAVDAHTVKFYFKQAPSVAQWQYGVLQGPIVQKKYWAAKVTGALNLLPAASSALQIELLKKRVADLQKRINELFAASTTATADEAHAIQIDLQHRQADLDQSTNDLSKAETNLDGAMQAGRDALYTLDNKNEPTLGTWMPAGQSNGAWVNAINPAHPFGEPHFDRAEYVPYAEPASAVAALGKGDVNEILDPQGIAAQTRNGNVPAMQVQSNASYKMRFLVLNPSNPALRDPELRRALFCSIDRSALARVVSASPLASFVLPGNGSWWNPDAKVSCGEGYDPLNSFDPSKAVSILKAAGYTWSTEPAGETPGAGLARPSGKSFPGIRLLSPSDESDSQDSAAGKFIESSARYLGIPLASLPVSPSDLRYAVFNDGNFDIAIVDWQVSVYPGYLCDWFGAGNPFHFQDTRVPAACQALDSTNDLEAAKAEISGIQSVLAEDIPFIPLYSGLTYDTYRGIRYPFDHVPGGLSGVYGAPALAMPVSP